MHIHSMCCELLQIFIYFSLSWFDQMPKRMNRWSSGTATNKNEAQQVKYRIVWFLMYQQIQEVMQNICGCIKIVTALFCGLQPPHKIILTLSAIMHHCIFNHYKPSLLEACSGIASREYMPGFQKVFNNMHDQCFNTCWPNLSSKMYINAYTQIAIETHWNHFLAV
jgi:hypothetical protein